MKTVTNVTTKLATCNMLSPYGYGLSILKIDHENILNTPINIQKLIKEKVILTA